LAPDGPADLPFLRDFAVHVRFLVCVPLLIVAEVALVGRTKAALKHFVRSGLIQEKDYPAFESVIARALRLRDSPLAEALILGVVVLSVALFRIEYSGWISSWQVLVSDAGRVRTLAGWWYLLIAIPLFQFLLARWLWRFLIWSHFLWSVSKMDLQLIPSHPDSAAGLGFLRSAQAKYGVVVFAVSSILAARIGEEILYGGASLLDQKFVIGGYIAMVVIILLAPLLVFTPKLFALKRKGLLEYGVLAGEYTQAFHRKWIRREAPEGESLLGSADIQSLADLGNSFGVVRNMRPLLIDRNTLLPIIAATALPMLPLLLTEYSFDALVLRIFELLF
jgi:hypothetical protein